MNQIKLDGKIFRLRNLIAKSGKDYIWLILNNEREVPGVDKPVLNSFRCMILGDTYQQARELDIKEGDEVTILGNVSVRKTRTDVGDKPTYTEETTVFIEKIRLGLEK